MYPTGPVPQMMMDPRAAMHGGGYLGPPAMQMGGQPGWLPGMANLVMVGAPHGPPHPHGVSPQTGAAQGYDISGYIQGGYMNGARDEVCNVPSIVPPPVPLHVYSISTPLFTVVVCLSTKKHLLHSDCTCSIQLLFDSITYTFTQLAPVQLLQDVASTSSQDSGSDISFSTQGSYGTQGSYVTGGSHHGGTF